jgi:hypothetical protein
VDIADLVSRARVREPELLNEIVSDEFTRDENWAVSSEYPAAIKAGGLLLIDL